ncbi:MAG: membrane fusion protein [Candidatus Azotimanducaceae bacterium]|jgi:membrane fusion protein
MASYQERYQEPQPEVHKQPQPELLKQPQQPLTSSGLFRAELAAQQPRLLGTICLVQPLSIYLWLSALLILTGLLVCFLLFAEHHRKENVRGYLVPDKGLLRVRSQRSGIVSAIHVREGEKVDAGDILISMQSQRSTTDGAELSDLLTTKLQQRISFNETALSNNKQLLIEQLESNEMLVGVLADKVRNLSEQSQLVQQRLDFQIKRVQAQRHLHESGHLPDAVLDQSEEALLFEQLGASRLQHQILSLQQEHSLAKRQAQQLLLQHGMTDAQLRQARAELDQQLGEVRSSFQSVIRASEPGVVTTLQVFEGQEVGPAVALLALIPDRSRLIAELLLPTRSIGLVKTGDEARLRFDAFPYQQFGLVTAEIIQIDRALLLPDTASPIQLREPVYRVRAALMRQEIGGDEAPYALRSGMQVEADILLEKRRLMDWVLKPLVGLKARMG